MDRRRLAGFAHSMRGHAEAGRTIEEQERVLEVWAAREGVELLGVWHGRSMDRGGLAGALAVCVQGAASGVVVECMDRLGDLVQQECFLEMMLRRGWSLWSTDEWEQRVIWGMDQDPQRELMRETIARVRRVDKAVRNIEKLTKRGSNRPAPYGYRDVAGRRVVDPDEGPIVAWILEMGAAGLGASQIAKVLNRADTKPRRAEQWTFQSVRRVMDRRHPLIEQMTDPDVAHQVVE